MKIFLVAFLVMAVAVAMSESTPDWLKNRPGLCPRDYWFRFCSPTVLPCENDRDCRPDYACCRIGRCGHGTCTRFDTPLYDFQKNRPDYCPRSRLFPPRPCSQLIQTCHYDWECSGPGGGGPKCCDQWGCNIGRCTT